MVFTHPRKLYSRHFWGTGNCNGTAVYFLLSRLLTVGKEKEEEKTQLGMSDVKQDQVR